MAGRPTTGLGTGAYGWLGYARGPPQGCLPARRVHMTLLPLHIQMLPSVFPAAAPAHRPPPAARWSPARRPWMLPAVLALGLALAGPAALAAPDCRVHWQVAPRLDTQPPSLSVRMSFDAGQRSLTNLRLAAGWAPVQPSAETAALLQPVADDPQLRQLRHAPGQRIELQWQFTPALASQAGGALLAERWFVFTGGTVLPWPDELAAQPAVPVCVTVTAPTGTTRLLSSFGRVDAAATQWSANTSMAQWQRALFAGGAWQTREVRIPGQALVAAMPDPAPFGFGIDTLAKSVATDLTALRQPWGAPETPPLLVLLLPGSNAPAGLALHQSMVIQAPAALPLPSESFDALLAAQWLRSWLPERLGPLSHLGRGDAVLRSWFTEGLADYLAHRWLLREGRWTAADYAAALNDKIARYQALPDLDANNLRVVTGRAGPEALALLPAARGEFLALAWHQALRRAGQPGLEALLYSLLVPAAQARPEGPTSAPLATHRLLAALRRPLGDAPLQMVSHHIEDGQRFSFGPQSLGPCFERQGEGSTAAYRAVDKALERGDCQGWLNGTPVGRAETTALAAAAADAPDAPAVGTRQVCRTLAPPKGAKGVKGAKAKPRTVCKTVTTVTPQAPAAKAAAASAAAGARAAGKAKGGAKAGQAAKGKSSKAKAASQPAGKAAAKAGARGSNGKPAAKPASKPAAQTARPAKPRTTP
jgi:hypothetical protein